jgi:hypothetical protein
LNTTLARGPSSPATKDLPTDIDYLTNTAQPFLEQALAAAQANDTVDRSVVENIKKLAELVPRYAVSVENAEAELEAGVVDTKQVPGVKASNLQEYLAYMEESLPLMVAEHQSEAVSRLRNLVATSQNFKALCAEEFAEVKEFETKTNDRLSQIKDYLKVVDGKIAALTDEATSEDIQALSTRETSYKELLDQLQAQVSPFVMWETKIDTETKEIINLLDGALANAQHIEHLNESQTGLQTAIDQLQDLLRIHQRVSDAEKFVETSLANTVAEVGEQEPQETAILAA